jgi:hypothetical protein
LKFNELYSFSNQLKFFFKDNKEFCMDSEKLERHCFEVFFLRITIFMRTDTQKDGPVNNTRVQARAVLLLGNASFIGGLLPRGACSSQPI